MNTKQAAITFLIITKICSACIHAESDTPINSNACPPAMSMKHVPIRPQGNYKFMSLIGTTRFTDQSDKDEKILIFSGSTTYKHSMRADSIMEFLLGSNSQSSSCRSITIEGSAIGNRDPESWLADYFYLPRDYKGTINFNPRISTYVLSGDLYAQCPILERSIYFRLQIPLVHTHWNLNMCETIESELTENSKYPPGYFSYLDITNEQLVQSFTGYMAGHTIQDPAIIQNAPVVVAPDVTVEDPNNKPSTASANQQDGITYHPLKFARMSPKACKLTKIADIRAEVGWNIELCSDYHLSINVQGAMPTGNKKDPCLLFSPQIGTKNHWELGGGISGHYLLCQNPDESLSLCAYFDTNITHLFNAQQTRTFDLCERPNSAYMLASKFGENINNSNGNAILRYVLPTDPPQDTSMFTAGFANIPDTQAVPKGIFDFQYAPVANLSTINIETKITAQVDLTAMLSLHTPHFWWNIGYNLWARSKEKIDICNSKQQDATGLCKKNNSKSNCWALKGDARMFGFSVTRALGGVPTFNVGPPRRLQPFPLSATQSTATINSGTNGSTSDSEQAGHTNPCIDNPQLATSNEAQILSNDGFILEGFVGNSGDPYPFLDGAGKPVRQINTSVAPIFLSYDDLDIISIKKLSHTIFTNFSLVCDKDGWEPFLSFGASIEIGRNKGFKKIDDCSHCKSQMDFTLSQWSVWLKGGVAFYAG